VYATSSKVLMMTKKIMIIDDEPDILIYLMTILEDAGFETCTIEENDQFMEAVQSEQPDLIIIDIMMPKRSGMSIYREIRSSDKYKKIPVAFISGMTSAKDFMNNEFSKLIDDEAMPPPDGYIEKPVMVEDLIKLVEKLIK
jgi:DNA-binding response OmpR family regulator